MLTTIGLPDLVADTKDAYVAIARDLACDRDRLRTIRNGLRERMYASPLMDHASFTADLGIAFQQMWQSWLANEERER